MAVPATTPSERAMSFISKGWKEVRNGADADLKLMRARANSLRDFAVSLDRLAQTYDPSNARSLELEFLKKIKPKLSELRRAYSAADVNSSSSLDLSLITKAFRNTRAVDDEGFYVGTKSKDRVEFRRLSNSRDKRIWTEDSDTWQISEWDPLKSFKEGIRDLDRKAASAYRGKSASELLENLRHSDFVESFRKSLRITQLDSEEKRDVPPLDVQELLANLVRQSWPVLDQLGFKKDVYNKVLDAIYYNKRRDPLDLDAKLMKDAGVTTTESERITDELDMRITSVLQSTGYHYQASPSNEGTSDQTGGGKRNVAIVTTASLPWMTGTAINPLFRAAYLSRNVKQNVTLLVPWLCKEDQELVYPNKMTFDSPEEQETYIRNWLEARVGFEPKFRLAFYPGKFSKERRSIIAVGDTTQFIPDREADIAVLEEPEHLNWYHHGKRWTDKFNHVIGVVHTNYLEYIKREKNGGLQSFFVKHINNWVTRIYCDKVLRLSAATQNLPKSMVCNVHGVSPKFLEIGRKVAMDRDSGKQSFSKGAYFLGKMVWGKGYRELVDLLAKYKSELDGFRLDVFGNGEDSAEVQHTAKRLELNMQFHQGRDHADDTLHGYKVFINPSVSDVLCTATAEALAMGKIVVCADHPSNEFFGSFPNCLMYKTPEEFVQRVKQALEMEPLPLSDEQQYRLSWEAATERFIDCADLYRMPSSGTRAKKSSDKQVKAIQSVSMPNLSNMFDNCLAFAHYCLTGSETARLCTGAIPGSRYWSEQHCKDLNILPPHVLNPVYGW
eukprot:TRINITY_DN534_c0_g3_i1.p1 TRINITY_DN534_c0_g3~~TRINITY_DN534_c0_g3_i1.p1  ORF type:complete len:783 (+),score=132.53 TRINITY_DN534_c0_g3_i1:389-2737(+)